MLDIDSDDDFIVCVDCGKQCDISEINRVILCTSKIVMLCLSCKIGLCDDALMKIPDKEDEDDEDDDDEDDEDIAQPVRMVFKMYEDISYSCCGRKNCVQTVCCGSVQGHVRLSSCDPELVNYPNLASNIKMRRSVERELYLNGRTISKFVSEPFMETNLLRRLRLQKTERERVEIEEVKSNARLIKQSKEIKEEKIKNYWKSLRETNFRYVF